MVAVIGVDAYPFFVLSDLTYHLHDLGISAFWLDCAADSKETELGTSDQEPLSAGKNTRIVLVPCLHMEVHPYSYSRWCGYF